MIKFFKFIIILVMLLPILSHAQTCPTNTNLQQPWAWPGHSNWYFGNGNIYNFKTNTLTPSATKDSYEGVSAASDDQGNLLFYTNGRNLWRANGTLSSSALLEGNEGGGTGMKGSASQGVITIRHPFAPDDYYVLTTDDALGGTLGLNYVVVGANGNIKSGPTRLGGFRTTEGIAATLHRNGLDVWVTVHVSGTTNFNSYLLTCSGFETTPVVSAVAPPSVTADKERGGLSFSPNGTKFVQGHPDYWPNSDKEITIYDFNNLTGQITNGIDISSTADADNPYDITFSTDGSLVYYTNGGTGVVWSINISSGVKATMVASRVNTGFGGGGFSALEIGPDGQLYVAGGSAKSSGKVLGSANLGLPTMYIPPSDFLEIQPITGVTICNVPYNISTLWFCKRTDAENTPRYENAYSIESAAGVYTIDPITGVFNTSTPGKYRVRFQICDVWDTLTFNVADCQNCNVQLKDVVPEICVGSTLLLDTMILSNNGTGVWSVDSVPTTASVNGSILINGSDTLFNATDINTKVGKYKLTYTITKGGLTCKDSIYVIVNPSPKPNLGNDVTICPESLGVVFDAGVYTSYLWSNNSTNQTLNTKVSGEYIVEVIDNNGCIGKDTVNLGLYVSPKPNLGVDKSICFGSNNVIFDAGLYTTYLWSSGETTQTISKGSSNDYSVTITDVNGCIGKDTVNLTVNPLPKPNLGVDKTVCLGVDVIFDAGLYNTYLWSSGETTQTISKGIANDYSVTITDGNGCVGKDTVKLITVTPPNPDIIKDASICPGMTQTFNVVTYNNGNGPFTYLWSNGQTTSSITSNIANSYWVDITDKYGCVGRDEADLTINNNLTPTILGSPIINICIGETTELISNYYTVDGYNFEWTPNNEITESITVGSSGVYNLHVDNGLGCEGDATIEVIVNPLPIVSDDNVSICSGQSTTIGNDVGPNNTYDWKTLNETTYQVSVSVSGNYERVVTNSFGCSDSSIYSVVVNPNPIVSLGNDIQVCEGVSVTLIDNNLLNGYSYSWSNGSITSSINPLTTGSYTLTVTNTTTGCVGSDEVLITFTPKPIVDLGNDVTICEGQSIVLNSNNTGLDITWNTGETTDDITISKSGEYSVIVSNRICDDKDTMVLTVVDLPNSGLTKFTDRICFDDYINGISLIGGGDLYNYLWSNGETTDSIKVTESGTYWVEISVGNCVISDTTVIQEYCPFTLYVPNAFTPNGDSKNNTFNAYGKNIVDFKMYIFDRWGEQIFESNDILFGWDGYYKGNLVQVDVYVYKIYYSAYNILGVLREYTKVGTVTVVR